MVDEESSPVWSPAELLVFWWALESGLEPFAGLDVDGGAAREAVKARVLGETVLGEIVDRKIVVAEIGSTRA